MATSKIKGGVIYGAWTATSSSATGTRLSDELTLDKGVWIVSFAIPPYSSSNNVGQIYLEGNDYRWASAGYATGLWVVTVETTKTVSLKAGSAANVSWNSSYLTRGGIYAVKVA